MTAKTLSEDLLEIAAKLRSQDDQDAADIVLEAEQMISRLRMMIIDSVGQEVLDEALEEMGYRT